MWQTTEQAWQDAETVLNKAYADWGNMGKAAKDVANTLDMLICAHLGYGEAVEHE